MPQSTLASPATGFPAMPLPVRDYIDATNPGESHLEFV
jgi:hypothetical protein